MLGNQFGYQCFPRLQVLWRHDGVFGRGDTEYRATTVHTVRKFRVLQLDPSRTPTFRHKVNPVHFSIYPGAHTNSSTTSCRCQRSGLFSDIETRVRQPPAQSCLGFPTSLTLNQRCKTRSLPLTPSKNSNLLGIISPSDFPPQNWHLQVISLPSCPKPHSVLASIQEKHLFKGICSSSLADTKTTRYLILGEHSLMTTTWDERPEGLTSTPNSARAASPVSESREDAWPLLTLISSATRLSQHSFPHRGSYLETPH